ncbi:MAG TPA: hypothetical protein ENN17_11675 [bacterium]|nr:hypothetical protein [bacterium]
MPVCKHCGVEIEEDLPCCPLCRSSIHGGDPVGEQNIRTPLPETAAHQKSWFWGLITLLGLGGGAIVSAVDLAYGMSITWSRYPLISIAYLWLTVSLFIYLRKHIYSLLLFETINLGLYLWILNSLTPITPWFFSLVIPLYILVSVFYRFDAVHRPQIQTGDYGDCGDRDDQHGAFSPASGNDPQQVYFR